MPLLPRRKLLALAFTAVGCLALLLTWGLSDKSTTRRCKPKRVAALLAKADRIVVTEHDAKSAAVLFSSTDPKDICDFRDAFTVTPPETVAYCACAGYPAIRLYRGDTEIALITNHHGSSVRCSLWDGNASLNDPEKWLEWFDKRNMPEPRKEFESQTTKSK